MFPIKKKILTHDSAWHLKMGEGMGADYEAEYVDLFMPFDGQISAPYPWPPYIGTGGYWLACTKADGDKIEMAHLSERYIKSGFVKQGTLIGKTGWTGRWRGNKPHLHIQIFRDGKRIPPEDYNWDEVNETLEQTIIRLFVHVWGRVPFIGEINVFKNRIAKKNIKITDLENKIQYAYDMRKKYNLIRIGKGDKWWDDEKRKWNV